MSVVSKTAGSLMLLGVAALPVATLSAQPAPAEGPVLTTTYGEQRADTTPTGPGPQVEGMISARSGDRIQITGVDGTRTNLTLTDATQVKAKKGLFGSKKMTTSSLINGLPVTVKTQQSAAGLVATQVALKNGDLKTAAMIHNGTDQRFGEQAAATEALRGRMADIDKYNVKATTNVNFDTGKAVLSQQAKTDLCSTAATAEQMSNALILVVGYTDSTGSDEFNQVLSEKRAAGVVNYLQQQCHWKPYRMLTPTGMATADPLASNDTYEGKAQNRRVAVNILVSKGLDGL